MMIIRLISYLLLLIMLCGTLAVSAVSWSFYESVYSSLNLLKYTSDNKARDILATVARVAETKMYSDGYNEMNDFFVRMIKQSEKDLDKFTIKEVFLISPEGVVLAHSNPSEITGEIISRTPSQKYNKPYYMRALRMRKGQLPTPQTFGQEYKGDETFFGRMMMRLFPELKYQTVLLSAPIYHLEKLETVGSIHLIYNRGNVLFFMESQKEIFLWMLLNYIGISFLVSIALWGTYVLFLFGSYKQGGRNTANIPEPELPKTLAKIETIFEKQEDTIKRYLTPIPLKLDNTILNAESITEIKQPPVHPENQTTAKVPKVESSSLNGSNGNGKMANTNNKANPTEALDAIYLD
ncbi:MAG TPA: hypothetical protein PK079_17940 [Leptospiraceae bacterium]|nr:hypothetical protein [Leptospiraceae bacterium]HMW05129.1 hypothetical protein [Leptospiraceae bacterium]HMX31383.1 hypothetical protein [Leptospiraceae bacterium]HMY31574.1 hypothetical protein [Leptospiraceae bacterium]HMZ66686.1 hypothetical protein [Leptospiraceae bacterium]